MTTTVNYEYINTDQQLQAFCQQLSVCDFLAIDTEFLRENTYRPQLCLVQIKSGELLALIDTIAINDLGPLVEILNDSAITKVFHAASQDLEIFYYLAGKVPSPLFDTQLAAPLLGYAEQIGYGNLVREMLGTELSKAHTRADWSRRPLSDKQIQYALDDVIYLEQLFLAMRQQLAERGRLQWLAAEFKTLEEVDRYDKPAVEMWKRIRAAQKLKNAPLAILQALAEWREIQARESNIPRNWLIKDDVLADLARQMPAKVEELEQIRGLGNRTRKQHGERLVQIIQAARQRQPEALPSYQKKLKITPAQSAAVDVLSALVNLRATEHKINPTLLASRKMLEECVQQGNCDNISGWRQALIGDELNQLLQGHIAIRIKAGVVVLSD